VSQQEEPCLPRKIILIHGLARDCAYWKPVLAFLQEIHDEVIVYPLPGHQRPWDRAGYLERCSEDILALLEADGHTTLMGHSLGTVIIAQTWLRLNRRDKISKVILEEPPMLYMRKRQWPLLTAYTGLAIGLKALDRLVSLRGRRNALQSFLIECIREKDAIWDDPAYYDKRLLELQNTDYAALWHTFFLPFYRDRFMQALRTMPNCFILHGEKQWGSYYEPLPEVKGAALQECLIPGTGHMALEGNPNAYKNALENIFHTANGE
jgi:pimeloyl-ACP methyl ester carboxylesterase